MIRSSIIAMLSICVVCLFCDQDFVSLGLIHEICLSGTVPTEWKKACTILIHKKGNTNVPSNFRPITLESIPLKVFTSCLRNAMFPSSHLITSSNIAYKKASHLSDLTCLAL